MKTTLPCVVVSLLLTGLCLFAGCAKGREDRFTNIVLFTFDTARADYYGCYGDPTAQTPVMDSLAKQGVLFENAFCQVPITLPSHASILTGLYPPHHGIRLNGAYRLPEEVKTLATVLKREGYTTAAFVSAFVLDSQFGLDRGFDVYDDEIVDNQQFRLSIAERRGDETANRAVAWLKTHPRRPFLLWVHFFDPHRPYAPPEPYRTEFRARPYAGEIAYADAMAGRVLTELEQLGLADSTLVVATSDHGEGLGEHQEHTHSFFVYDTTVRIPLVFCLPKGISHRPAAWQPGARITSPAESVDITPTLLDLLGIQSETHLDGRSLVETSEASSRHAYAESLYPLSFGWSPLQSARQGEWKYIAAPTPELYNVKNDPGERMNQFAERPQVAAALSDWLKEFAESTKTAAGKAEPMEPETVAALRSLGYVAAGISRKASDEWSRLPDPKDRVETFDWINEARELCNSGSPEVALSLLAPLKSVESENAVFLQVLGISLVRAGRFESAIESLSRYRELSPGDPESSYCLGVAWLRGGSPERAVDPLEKCVEQMPTYAAAWDQLGVARGMMNQLQQSLEAGDRAVTLEPANPDYRKNRGVTLLGLGRAAEAEAEFNQALKLRRNSLDFRYHLGLALSAQRKFDRAAEIFRAILEIQPGHAQAKQRLAEIDRYLGKQPEEKQINEK